MFYLEQTKMSKYKFAQKSGMPLSTLYDIAKKEDYDILWLPPGDILLPSLNYGFMGGVGGKISDDSLAFFGKLDYYKYGKEIKLFLSKYDIKPIYLSQGKLIDRGSLMCL